MSLRRSRNFSITCLGGGVSGLYARPYWQFGPGLPEGTKRISADLSVNADPWTGYAFYYEGNWEILGGGTSFGAPNVAGLWALMFRELRERDHLVPPDPEPARDRTTATAG